jgi:von Willebrand factor type A C-terminal domain
MARLLSNVVEVVDAANGTIRLKTRADNVDVDIDAEIAAVGSTKTQRERPN